MSEERSETPGLILSLTVPLALILIAVSIAAPKCTASQNDCVKACAATRSPAADIAACARYCTK